MPGTTKAKAKPVAPPLSMNTDAHNLMPQDIRAVIPRIYGANGQDGDTIVQVKWFTPDSSWTWYVTEFDGEDECFGVVCGHETGMGYFSLSEIQELRGPLGLRVERDLYFRPRPISGVAALDEWAQGMGWIGNEQS